MNKLLVLAAATTVSAGLFGGIAVAAPVINNTGPNSTNKVVVTDKLYCTQKNNNVVGVENTTGQTSKTGKAKVKNNTTAGGATTGAAGNTNTTTGAVTVTNDSAALGCDNSSSPVDLSDARIRDTGRRSLNVISSTQITSLKVVNNNTVGISNTTLQGSYSGNATVQGNTTGGSATSGNSTNSNSSSFTINISN